jgi:DUF4097 and DUF4098 domain-containing protein YvlB
MVQSRRSVALITGIAVVVAAGCNLQLSTDVEASDTWTRTYPISATGSLSITNSNGRIDVTGTDGTEIEISAERIVRAGSEEAVNEQLKVFEMNEEVTPDRISIDSSNRGIPLNTHRRVNYTVRVPRGITVRLQSSNGDLSAEALTGSFIARTSNGRIRGTELAGPTQATTLNGIVELTMAAIAEGGVTAETSNGRVTVALPRDAHARISARVANGSISHDGLDLQIIESSRRRLDSRLGDGGPEVRAETSNGTVRLVGR